MSGVSAAPVLEVEDLRVGFAGETGVTQAVDGVSLTLSAGEVLAIVGESGSGKSVTALSIMGLTRGAGARVEGSALFEGRELLGAGEEELRRLRGARIAMVFQDPSSSFNPVYRVGSQIDEAIRAHRRLSAAARSASSANRAAARASPRSRSWASCRSRRAASPAARSCSRAKTC